MKKFVAYTYPYMSNTGHIEESFFFYKNVRVCIIVNLAHVLLDS